MTRAQAKQMAQTEATKAGIPIAIVQEVYPDEFAERDADGHSYGFCPQAAFSTLYRFGWGKVVEEVKPEAKDATIQGELIAALHNLQVAADEAFTNMREHGHLKTESAKAYRKARQVAIDTVAKAKGAQ